MSMFIGIIKRSVAVEKLRNIRNYYKKCEKSKYYFHFINDYGNDQLVPCWRKMCRYYPDEYKGEAFVRRLQTYIKLYLSFYNTVSVIPFVCKEYPNGFRSFIDTLYKECKVISRGYSNVFGLVEELFEPTYKKGEQVFPNIIGPAYINAVYTSGEIQELVKLGHFKNEENGFIEFPISGKSVYAQMCFKKTPEVKLFVNITDIFTKEEHEKLRASAMISFMNISAMLSFNEYEGAKLEKIVFKS